jgi:hypothetical protein
MTSRTGPLYNIILLSSQKKLIKGVVAIEMPGRWPTRRGTMGQWQRENNTGCCWPERDSAATVEERGQGYGGHDKAWWGLEHGLPDWGTRALRCARLRCARPHMPCFASSSCSPSFVYSRRVHADGFGGGFLAVFICLIIRLIQLVFSAETIFFSHKKSVNSVFQPGYNSSRTAPCSVR